MGRKADYAGVSALSDWFADAARMAARGAVSREACESLLTGFRTFAPPVGWRPQNGTDSLIQRAFVMAGLIGKASEDAP